MKYGVVQRFRNTSTNESDFQEYCSTVEEQVEQWESRPKVNTFVFPSPLVVESCGYLLLSLHGEISCKSIALCALNARSCMKASFACSAWNLLTNFIAQSDKSSCSTVRQLCAYVSSVSCITHLTTTEATWTMRLSMLSSTIAFNSCNHECVTLQSIICMYHWQIAGLRMEYASELIIHLVTSLTSSIPPSVLNLIQNTAHNGFLDADTPGCYKCWNINTCRCDMHTSLLTSRALWPSLRCIKSALLLGQHSSGSQCKHSS